MQLTELENAVLGVVWRRGPCSAYVIKREFESSLSGSWSASAGSIYPLVKKLIGMGLLDRRQEPWGRGTKALVELTGDGQRALVEWVGSVSTSTARASADPIRTRAFFLDVLNSDAHRRRFIADAEQATKGAIAELQRALSDMPANESIFEAPATEGAIFQLRGRLRWLRRLRQTLIDQSI